MKLSKDGKARQKALCKAIAAGAALGGALAGIIYGCRYDKPRVRDSSGEVLAEDVLTGVVLPEEQESFEQSSEKFPFRTAGEPPPPDRQKKSDEPIVLSGEAPR